MYTLRSGLNVPWQCSLWLSSTLALVSTSALSTCPVVPQSSSGRSKLRSFSKSASSKMTSKYFHIKCRYPNEYCYKGGEGESHRVVRHEVPAGLISWDLGFDTYDPISFTAPHVLTAPWADSKLAEDGFHPQWNALDGKVNRKSHEGVYRVSEQHEPMNICGRTGLGGRGVLGRWGPNHAADPIVTRWKRDAEGKVVYDDDSHKPILQFVAIQRRDNGEWAIPGGMVDPGENVSQTVRREFMEEAMDSTQKSPQEREAMTKDVEKFFDNGQEIYAGYVDDPRNTDNAWMETVAFLFHDENGEDIGKFDLKAGDDAQALQWMDVSKDLNLYASHSEFIQKAAQYQGAHW